MTVVHARAREMRCICGVSVWNSRTGEVLLDVHTAGPPKSGALHPSGKWLATLTSRQVEIWNTEDGSRLDTFLSDERREAPSRIQVAPNGEQLVLHYKKSAAVHHWGDWQKIREVAFGWRLDGVEFLNDGKLLFVGADPSTSNYVWFDPSTGKQYVRRGILYAKAVQLSRDRQQCIPVGIIRIATPVSEPATLDPIGRVLSDTESSSAAFIRDGHVLVGLWEGRTPDNKKPFRVECLNVKSGELVAPPLVHPSYVAHIAVSPDDQLVATSSVMTVRVWNYRTGEMACAPLNHTRPIRAIGWTPAGELMICCEKESIKVWELGRPLEVARIDHSGPVTRARFGNGKLITGSIDGSVRVTDLQSGHEVFPPLRHGPPIRSFSVSPTGRDWQ